MDNHAELKKYVDFLKSRDMDEALVRDEQNQTLVRARLRQDKELEKANQNYMITKQILEQTLKVKMSYQNIIESAMATESI